MVPPAPPRFSTTSGWPSGFSSFCARMRATMSVDPPGGKGTMTRIGLAGQLCPYAEHAANANAHAATMQCSSLIFYPPPRPSYSVRYWRSQRREPRMKRTCIAALLAAFPLAVSAQWNVPPESQRCPSKWGAGDEKGSGNHMKNPQVVLRGARLIKTGEVIELSHVLGPGMPFFGPRIMNMQPKRTFMNPGRNTRGSNEELLTGEFGQIGTQFDGFAHQSHGDSHYNCFKTSEIGSRNGFNKLGVQNAPTFFTRGVLIDVAALKGVEMLGDSYEITVADLEQALAKQGNLRLQPGDAVIIHTGWGKL